MKTLLILLALATPAAAQNYGHDRYYYRRQQAAQRPVVQQNVQRVYMPRPRYYQPLLYGYGYGPNMYGTYTSANQPVFIQTTINDPFGYGYGY